MKISRAILRLLSAPILIALFSSTVLAAPRPISRVPAGWPKMLNIAKMGIKAPVEALSLDKPYDSHAPYKWGDVAWYKLGPRPGDQGHAIVYGHLDSTCCPAVFYQLRRLRSGDTVQVAYKQGKPLMFRVQWQAIYPNSHLPLKFMYANTRDRGVLLITCTGVFHRDGTGYDHKLFVYAKLVSGA